MPVHGAPAIPCLYTSLEKNVQVMHCQQQQRGWTLHEIIQNLLIPSYRPVLWACCLPLWKESSSPDTYEKFTGRPYAVTQAPYSEGLWSFCRQGYARRAQCSRHCRHECGWKRTKCQIRQYPAPGIHPPPIMRIPERQCILRLTCRQGKAYMYCSAAPCGNTG